MALTYNLLLYVAQARSVRYGSKLVEHQTLASWGAAFSSKAAIEGALQAGLLKHYGRLPDNGSYMGQCQYN